MWSMLGSGLYMRSKQCPASPGDCTNAIRCSVSSRAWAGSCLPGQLCLSLSGVRGGATPADIPRQFLR